MAIRFSHLISVDYFEDLLALLKKIMQSYHPDYQPSAQEIIERRNKQRHVKLKGGEAEEVTETDIQGDKVRMPLLCVITAAQILSGQGKFYHHTYLSVLFSFIVGEAINYDLKDFYTLLYTLLFPVAMKASASEIIEEDGISTVAQSSKKRKTTTKSETTRVATDAELVMRGLDMLLLQRKHVPVERVAAFLKRIATVSLHLSSSVPAQMLQRINTAIQASLVILTLNDIANQFIKQRRNQLDALLSDEDGRMGNGIYLPELDDPDLCNPLATSMWELALLKVSNYCRLDRHTDEIDS
jgi:nucleolar complex protein 3